MVKLTKNHYTNYENRFSLRKSVKLDAAAAMPSDDNKAHGNSGK